MEHAKRLYLIDEFDREYKRVQRPSAVVAKARSAVQLDDTLAVASLMITKRLGNMWPKYIVI